MGYFVFSLSIFDLKTADEGIKPIFYYFLEFVKTLSGITLFGRG